LEIGSYAAVLYFISFGWVRVGAATRAEAQVANPVTVILDFSSYDFAHFLVIFPADFPAQIPSRDGMGRISKILKTYLFRNVVFFGVVSKQ
jgi:hypothetical protein